MGNVELKQRWAGWESFLRLTNWVFWQALAVTTGVMVYAAFSPVVQKHVPPNYQLYVLIAIILGIYFMVDHGLSPKIKAWFRNRHEIKDTPKTSHEYRLQRSLLRVVFLFLLLRVSATALSSIWAGGEISQWTNQGDPTEDFRAAVSEHDAANTHRIDATKSDYEALRKSEGDRVARSAQKGDLEIAAAIRKGNRHQREMYWTNPNFFNNLSPTSQWTPGNQEFIDRINKAKANKAAYIAEARGETRKAKDLYASAASTSNSNEFENAMSEAALLAIKLKDQRVKRHNRMVVWFDIFCLIGGLFTTFMLVKIEIITGGSNERRTVSYLLSMWATRQYVVFMDGLERFLNLDIDHDGHIGKPNLKGYVPSKENRKRDNRIEMGSGFTSKPKKVKPLASTSKELASTSKEIETLKRAYSNMKSRAAAWKSNADKANSEKSKNHCLSRMIECEEEMKEYEKQLAKLGHTIGA